MHLQFWSGVPTKPGWESEDLEIFINKVHDENMIGPLCGFDQWIDNHIAIDAGPGEVNMRSHLQLKNCVWGLVKNLLKYRRVKFLARRFFSTKLITDFRQGGLPCKKLSIRKSPMTS